LLGLFLDPEDEVSMFSQNIHKHLPEYTASPEDGIFHCHRRENIKSNKDDYPVIQSLQNNKRR
jgi:hypothetical protein